MMSALAQPTRLSVFEQLAAELPGGLPVGELARRVGTPPNTMSTHLAILSRAGLVEARRDGRVITYTAVPMAARNLSDWLLQCVSGAPS